MILPDFKGHNVIHAAARIYKMQCRSHKRLGGLMFSNSFRSWTHMIHTESVTTDFMGIKINTFASQQDSVKSVKGKKIIISKF